MFYIPKIKYTARRASPIFSADYNSGLAGYKPIIIYINKYDEICEIYCYGWWEPGLRLCLYFRLLSSLKMYKIKERLELLRGMLSLCENRTGVKLSILYNI